MPPPSAETTRLKTYETEPLPFKNVHPSEGPLILFSGKHRKGDIEERPQAR